MKILLFISKLYGGGAERVASILLNHLSQKHSVTAAIFDANKKSYPINSKVEIINLSEGKNLNPYQLNRIVKCRRTIKTLSPDLIISFLVGMSRFVVISNLFINKNLILSERTSIQAKQPLWQWLTRRLLYPIATKVVFVSESDYNYAKWLSNKTFIYNPLSCDTIFCNNIAREKVIVSIGAQSRWQVKGFDMLVRAWAKIAPLHPSWKLQFIGETDDSHIKQLSESLGIENQVDFLGWTDDIAAALQTKSIYALSSRLEGFPNSLIEAMSQGCACVAFSCKTGPDEIITDGISGLLARNGDTDDIAAKLQLLIEDENLRKRLSVGATDEVKRFEMKKIMQQWDLLIES